uniref:Cytochrome P450 n=1 Tax=Populus trichocarpa TaxID=3694 RepID=A0A2K2B3Y8_POPTR
MERTPKIQLLNLISTVINLYYVFQVTLLAQSKHRLALVILAKKKLLRILQAVLDGRRARKNDEHPEYFNHAKEHRPKSSSDIPFGIGSRLCPGGDLDNLEISIFLHCLLLNYKPEFLSFLAGFSKTMLVDSWSSFSNQSEVIVWFLMSLVKTSLGPRLSSQINEARDVGVTCKMIL